MAELEELRRAIEEVKQELAELAQREAATAARLEEIEKRLDNLERIMLQRNGYLKWMMVLLGMILSFIAAMFGLGWRPPG